MVKFKLTKLSQPFCAPPMMLNVAVLLDEEYTFPSIQVIGEQDEIFATPVLG